MIPIIVGNKSIADDDLYKVNNSTNPDIEIAGIPTRKESLAAVFLSIPDNNAEVKVTPDLETPGIIARDCERPKSIISINIMSENNFFFLPEISAKASKIDIIIETIAMENKPLKCESEKFDQNNLISKPKINIGILATTIKEANLVFSSLNNLRWFKIDKPALIITEMSERK